MAISREKEQAEVGMDGAYATWSKFNAIRAAYAALSAAQWNTIRTAVGNGLQTVTQAQAVAFMQTRQDEAMIEMTAAVNIWRLTP